MKLFKFYEICNYYESDSSHYEETCKPWKKFLLNYQSFLRYCQFLALLIIIPITCNSIQSIVASLRMIYLCRLRLILGSYLLPIYIFFIFSVFFRSNVQSRTPIQDYNPSLYVHEEWQVLKNVPETYSQEISHQIYSIIILIEPSHGISHTLWILTAHIFNDFFNVQVISICDQTNGRQSQEKECIKGIEIKAFSLISVMLHRLIYKVSDTDHL